MFASKRTIRGIEVYASRFNEVTSTEFTRNKKCGKYTEIEIKSYNKDLLNIFKCKFRIVRTGCKIQMKIM